MNEWLISDYPSTWTILVAKIIKCHFLFPIYHSAKGRPLWDVNVTLPLRITDNELALYGLVMANYTSGKGVHGNATAVIQIREAGSKRWTSPPRAELKRELLAVSRLSAARFDETLLRVPYFMAALLFSVTINAFFLGKISFHHDLCSHLVLFRHYWILNGSLDFILDLARVLLSIKDLYRAGKALVLVGE